jgi:hypothetical protein
MSDFSFRLRIRLASRDRLGYQTEAVLIPLAGFPADVEIRSQSGGALLNAVSDLVFIVAGFHADREARDAGERFVSDLRRTFTRLGMGADFGELSKQGLIYPAGREMLEQLAGTPVLNDIHGLMTFPSTLRPRFASVGNITVTQTMQSERFERVLNAAQSRSRQLTRKELLAFELYTASCFLTEPRARFLSLCMAVEALIHTERRPQRARWLIEGFLHTVEGDLSLKEDERSSLLGGLARLKEESIGAAGRRLARERLRGRNYMDMQAEDFFQRCYRLRGQMVHGQRLGSDVSRISAIATTMETFVANLLTYDLLDIDA